MLDLNLIRENPDLVRTALSNRQMDASPVDEILRLDDEIRELIVRREPVRQVKELARAKGARSLTEAALDLVAAGLTTLEEARRVTVAA